MTEKVVLLEDIHPSAGETFEAAGLEVVKYPKSISAAGLGDLVQDATILGVRSGPRVPAEILEGSETLQAVGCFGVGLDHIDVTTGIPVFNANHENTRSVADYVIGSVYSLLRRLHEHNLALHAGEWTKTDKQTYELRGKTIGIIGYGAIGSQVSVLAESVGMSVKYFDPKSKFPPYGQAKKLGTKEEVLEQADVVTLHVPGGQTHIDRAALDAMRPGSYLINSARADVVDIAAVEDALDSGQLAGFATDVYESEPTKAGDDFSYRLQGNRKVLLTPHIGGSTQEAQAEIGRQNAERLLDYLTTGSTMGAVNIYEMSPDNLAPGSSRLSHIHKNERGVAAAVNKLIAAAGYNLSRDRLETYNHIGYMLCDIEGDLSDEVLRQIQDVDHTIRARVIARPALT